MRNYPIELFLPKIPFSNLPFASPFLFYSTVYSWMLLANFFPVIIACGLWFGVDGDKAPLAGFMGLIGSSGIGVAVTTYFLNEKMNEAAWQEVPGRWTWGSIWWELTFSNIFALKNRVEPVIQYIPDLWCYLIKGLIPHLLIIVFVNAAATENSDGDSMFYHYGAYPAKPYQAMGIVCFLFALVLILIGFAYPPIYAALATAYEEEHLLEVKELNELEEEAKVAEEVVDDDDKKEADGASIVVDGDVEMEA
jgi:hypothetical protein